MLNMGQPGEISVGIDDIINLVQPAKMFWELDAFREEMPCLHVILRCDNVQILYL